MSQEKSEQKDPRSGEIKTVSFRLREIQRMLAMRVVQENRRLKEEGLEPVDESPFFEKETDFLKSE